MAAVIEQVSLVGEYRVERARDALAEGIAMTGGPKLTVIEGGSGQASDKA